MLKIGDTVIPASVRASKILDHIFTGKTVIKKINYCERHPLCPQICPGRISIGSLTSPICFLDYNNSLLVKLDIPEHITKLKNFFEEDKK